MRGDLIIQFCVEISNFFAEKQEIVEMIEVLSNDSTRQQHYTRIKAEKVPQQKCLDGRTRSE
jgi:hypothetical protein